VCANKADVLAFPLPFAFAFASGSPSATAFALAFAFLIGRTGEGLRELETMARRTRGLGFAGMFQNQTHLLILNQQSYGVAWSGCRNEAKTCRGLLDMCTPMV
jgi:hypothetical protein